MGGVEQTPLKWEKWTTHILLECFLVVTYGLLALQDPLLTGCGVENLPKDGEGESASRAEGGWADPSPEPENRAVRTLLECSLMLNLFFRKKSLKSVIA